MTPQRALRLFPALFLLGLIAVLDCPAFAQEAMPPSVPADQVMKLDVQDVSPPIPEQIPEIDPLALYGGDVVFDVYRKGSKVGEHRAKFARQGDDLTVTTHFDLAVDVLFFTAYKFDYDSTEVWRKGQLQAVSVNVDDNGKVSSVKAKMEDGLFKIEGPRGAFIASSWVFPTNHWNRGQANSKTILNTLTGGLAQVTIINRGIQRVETAQGSVDADHFEYTGDLHDTHVWYDAQNRWVKMRFKGRDGSVIEYRCRECGLAPGQTNAIADEGAIPAPKPTGPS